MGLNDLRAKCYQYNTCSMTVFMILKSTGARYYIDVEDFYIDAESNKFMNHMTGYSGTA